MAGGSAIHAWLFEVKGIQPFLFASGRLRDVVGASDLLCRIATPAGDDLIGLAITACGAQVDAGVTATSSAKVIVFSRRAGGAFCVHCNTRETLVDLRRDFLVRLISALPGLPFEDSLGQGDTELAARDAAFAARSGARSNGAASVLPLGRPVFAVNRRTGLPITGAAFYREDRVDMDRVLDPIRARADALQTLMGQRLQQAGQAGSFVPEAFVIDGAALRMHQHSGANVPYVYPRNLEDGDEDTDGNPLFPWMEGSTDRRIALVHADISGLGQLFQAATVSSAADALKLGNAIDEAIGKAIGRATAELLHTKAVARPDDRHNRQIVPARPLVVGGDDITVLVRADLAVPFAARLVQLIEEETKGLGGLVHGLSAGAGIAISRKGLPFLTMNALAESLCKYAKARAKQAPQPWPSMLAFHVYSQTAEEDFAEDILPSLQTPGGKVLTDNPYTLAGADDLVAVAKAINGVDGAFGTLRTLATHLAAGEDGVAGAKWRRFWARTDRSAEQNEQLGKLKKLLGGEDLPASGAVFDALELIDLGAVQ